MHIKELKIIFFGESFKKENNCFENIKSLIVNLYLVQIFHIFSNTHTHKQIKLRYRNIFRHSKIKSLYRKDLETNDHKKKIAADAEGYTCT